MSCSRLRREIDYRSTERGREMTDRRLASHPEHRNTLAGVKARGSSLSCIGGIRGLDSALGRQEQPPLQGLRTLAPGTKVVRQSSTCANSGHNHQPTAAGCSPSSTRGSRACSCLGFDTIFHALNHNLLTTQFSSLTATASLQHIPTPSNPQLFFPTSRQPLPSPSCLRSLPLQAT